MDLLAALDIAVTEFGRRIAGVGAGQWSSPTPCDEWDVQYLVAHVVGGNRFTVAVLSGHSAADAIDEVMSSPQLGTDPVEAWATTAAAQFRAFSQPNALDEVVDHPLGPIAGRQLLGYRVFDITLHAWDLARAIGVDDTLPDKLVTTVLDIIASGPPGMGFSINPTQPAANASLQAQLLALAGRSGRDTTATP
ncbi:MAG: hypothetical protein RL238_3082 [Actinomycetota bacterium]|jgi:uncharacterized protein (TIGR03086 family)